MELPTSVYLTKSSFILSVLLRVFQVRKHNLISALVADPYRGDTIRRLTKNGRILLPADETEPCINFFYRLSLGDGATKLVHRISEHYFGISKNRKVSFSDSGRIIIISVFLLFVLGILLLCYVEMFLIIVVRYSGRIMIISLFFSYLF